MIFLGETENIKENAMIWKFHIFLYLYQHPMSNWGSRWFCTQLHTQMYKLVIVCSVCGMAVVYYAESSLPSECPASEKSSCLWIACSYPRTRWHTRWLTILRASWVHSKDQKCLGPLSTTGQLVFSLTSNWVEDGQAAEAMWGQEKAPIFGGYKTHPLFCTGDTSPIDLYHKLILKKEMLQNEKDFDSRDQTFFSLPPVE